MSNSSWYKDVGYFLVKQGSVTSCATFSTIVVTSLPFTIHNSDMTSGLLKVNFPHSMGRNVSVASYAKKDIVLDIFVMKLDTLITADWESNTIQNNNNKELKVAHFYRSDSQRSW